MLPPWKKKLPLQLTLSRVYALPVVIALMGQESLGLRLAGALLFILASVTDYFDGHLARKWNLVTNFGKFFDPVTDKILVSGALTYMVYLGKIDPYSVILLIVRDTFVGGLRSAAAADQLIIDAKPTGKWKTGLQMGAIPLLILAPWPEPLEALHNLGKSILWVSVGLSLWSGWEYFLAYKFAARPSTTGKKEL